jgi:uncharacterized protein Yka (UPF0111/DUF47 family)
MKELNKAFITPIDREDIFEIAKSLDDIVDAMECVSHRFIMFNVKSMTEYAKIISKLIIQSTQELKDLMSEMRRIKNSKVLLDKY